MKRGGRARRGLRAEPFVPAGAGLAERGARAGIHAEEAGREVLFGQARVGAHFSTAEHVPGYLSGRSLVDVAEDLRAGRLTSDDILVQAFEHEGQLVAINNRGLTTLSMAGMRPTNLLLRAPTAQEFRRLSEISVLGDTLPARRIAVTASRRDLTPLFVVGIPK